jgi:hypothetical protein
MLPVYMSLETEKEREDAGEDEREGVPWLLKPVTI